jgi:hypothetical protein
MICGPPSPRRTLYHYLELQAQGFSLRQAAKALEVPRSTLQAWRAYQESLSLRAPRRFPVL